MDPQQVDYAMLKTREASGEPPPREDSQLIPFLARMMALIGPGSPEAWRGVFSYLGEHHSGTNRFNIIWAILSLCNSVAAIRRWGRTWMMVLPYADIHPISMALCAASLPPRLQEPILSIYRRNFPGRTNPTIQELVKSALRPDDGSCRSWTVILPPHHTVKGLVSVLPITVREAVIGSTTTLGERWCLRELAVCGISGLTTIGPGLIVQSNLGLYLCPITVEIQHDSVIGGSAWVVPNEFNWGLARILGPAQGEWRMQAGWEEGGEFWHSDADGAQISVRPTADPILFPDSWLRMYYGQWGGPAKGGL